MATPRSLADGGAVVVGRLLEALSLPRTEPLPLLVHRLDVGTSGVVLLARGTAAHRALSLAIQERRATKTYRALVWGQPVPARGTIDAPLGRDRSDGRRMAVEAGGKPSVTAYETLRRLGGIADLRLAPATGRTHQIRVHLSSLGHPIVGDDLYGGATRWHGVRDPARRRVLAGVSRPLLHAERIVVAELGIDVEAPLPADYLSVLAALSGSPARPDPARRAYDPGP